MDESGIHLPFSFTSNAYQDNTIIPLAAPLQGVWLAVRAVAHRAQRAGDHPIGADEAEDDEVVVAQVVVVVGDERLPVGRNVGEHQ